MCTSWTDVIIDNLKDTQARAEILAEQQRVKKLKDRARIDRMLAKKRGDLRRMPLTGKAALTIIRGNK